jgi:hypothetical protein
MLDRLAIRCHHRTNAERACTSAPARARLHERACTSAPARARLHERGTFPRGERVGLRRSRVEIGERERIAVEEFVLAHHQPHQPVEAACRLSARSLSVLVWAAPGERRGDASQVDVP